MTLLSTNNPVPKAKAAEFTRPLLLTPSEDWKGYLSNAAGRIFLFMVTFLSVIAVLLIFIFIIREATEFLTGNNLKEFFTSVGWYPTHDPPEFGILAIMAGTGYVTIVALIIAVPLGILAAVYLSDIAPFKLRQVVKPIIEILAAIPSVAYGFFAVLVFSPWLEVNLDFIKGTNALNAGIILALMALPTIISVAEDSLSAVGREIREAAYGLGSTRAETLIKVVIPEAHSGIIAAVILGMMRAIGETMVVLMAAGMSSQIPSPWWDLADGVRPMTATIAQEMGETPKGSLHYQALFAIGFFLLVFTFGLNMLSEHFLARVRKRKRG